MSLKPDRIPRSLRLDSGDIIRIRRTFDFDPGDTIRVGLTDASGSFKQISPRQRRRVMNNLSTRRRRHAISHIAELIGDWKAGTHQNRESACRFERIVKISLGTDADLRCDMEPDGDIGETLVNTFQDLYRVSQAFLHHNYGDGLVVYRGIRDQSIATLVAQVLDTPDAEQFYFETSVISNHSGSEGIGFNYSNGIVIEWNVHRYFISLAIDHLFETPTPEDEVHVAGGVIKLGPDAVLHEGHHSGDVRRLSTTISSMDSPESLSYQEHMDIVELVRIMASQGIGPRTEDGAERLGNWFRAFQGLGPLDDKDLNRLQNVIESVRLIAREKDWAK